MTGALMPLELSLKPSPLRLGLLLLYLVPLLCLFGEGVTPLARIIVAALVLLCLWQELRALRPLFTTRLVLQDSGQAVLCLHSDADFPIVIKSQACVLDWLQVCAWETAPEIEFKQHGRFCLVRDAFSMPQWRAMRAWMRCYRNQDLA